MPRPTAIALLLLTTAGLSAAIDFDREIRPLLQDRCVECHGPKKNKADLRLDAKPHALKGGESGPAFIAGDAAKSLLFERITSKDEDTKMPPKGEPLTPAQVEKVRQWIAEGAIWPENGADRAALRDPRLDHWSYQPVRRPAQGSKIDDFIEAALQAKGLGLSMPADPRTLIRRAYFDVIGLPPTPEEVAAFVADPSDRAYEAMVGRLLASPRFGEKWARHWLDVARFAESDGFETNLARPNAWPYRDYVIQALNADLPYDRFIREQLAGDQLGADAATGFLVGGPWDRVKSPDPVLTANQRADELHDMIGTTASAFLGATLACARCHDHKFDPVPTTDYYAFMAMLQGVQHGERELRDADSDARERQAETLRAELRPIEQSLRAFKPKAYLGRILLADDSDARYTQQVELPDNGNPIAYDKGTGKGLAQDPGDVRRLPNLGESYRWWRADKPGEDFFTWKPSMNGPVRIWISWGAWTTHASDARYVLDLDGDLKTKDDQTEIARINQRQFADGSPAVKDQRRWSGLKSAGVHRITSRSVLILRAGDKGGPTAADLAVFEEAKEGKELAVPHLRAPVTHLANEEDFDPVEAKFVRFTITGSNPEACIDELEVFDLSGKNLSLGAKVSVSGLYANGNSIHQTRFINDGTYGNRSSWISSEKSAGWAQLEFDAPTTINRVVWSRNRDASDQRYKDRLAYGYRIEASADGKQWTKVASSDDRLSITFKDRVSSLPTLGEVPADKAAQVEALTKRHSQLLSEITRLTTKPRGYVGKFEQPGPTLRKHRGDPTQPREPVAPGTLSLVGRKFTLPADAPESDRRKALADWIASKDNPLTARVIVNRLWHHHFGTGIVDTPSDLGLNGSRPTHPELLDFLAAELMDHGWSLKHVHRLILTSRTFRQDSKRIEKAAAIDAAARLLWRYPPRRIEAEMLRDSMLATAGRLDLTMGGPGFDLFEPMTNYVKVYVTKQEFLPGDYRRMVYQSKPRAMLDDFFGAFDCPDAGQPQPKRTASITPLQSLNLLNGSFSLQQAAALSERLRKEAGEDSAKQASRAFELLFQRPASAEELAEASRFIAAQGLPAFCRAMYNANEFVRIE
jgi:cytochrome c553